MAAFVAKRQHTVAGRQVRGAGDERGEAEGRGDEGSRRVGGGQSLPELSGASHR